MMEDARSRMRDRLSQRGAKPLPESLVPSRMRRAENRTQEPRCPHLAEVFHALPRRRTPRWLAVMFQHVVRTPRVWQAGGGCTRNPQPSLSDTMHANATLTPLMRAKLVRHHLAS